MAVDRAARIGDAVGGHELVPHHQIPESAPRRPVGDDQRLVLVEHKTAIGITGVAGRPAEVGVRYLVGVGELVCRMSDLMAQRVRLVGSRTDGQRDDREHRAHPSGAGPQACRRLGVPVPNRFGLIKGLDLPADRATGDGIGLVVAGHQHRRVGCRSQLKREVADGIDLEVVVAHDGHDAVRPRAR